MIWLESQPGGGSLYTSNQSVNESTISQQSKGRISLADPYPPPMASPNMHQWTRRSHSRYSGDVGSPSGGSSLLSPRSSTTSEHSPRILGGWLWWLGI